MENHIPGEKMKTQTQNLNTQDILKFFRISSQEHKRKDLLTYNKLPRLVKESIERTVMDISILYYKPRIELPKNLVNIAVIGATGGGKTNLVKLIAINGGYTKAIILTQTRRFKDLEVFHGIEVQYLDNLNDLVKYVTTRLELDYMTKEKTIIIIDDLNKVIETEKQKGSKLTDIWNKIIMVSQNVRQYNATLVIVGHTYEDLKQALNNEAYAVSLDFIALGRLSLSEYKIRTLPRRLIVSLTPSILRSLKNLNVGEFYLVSKQWARKIQVTLLPSHYLTQILPEWLIIENGSGNTKELIKKLALRGLNYKEIAEIVGTTPQYVAKVLTMLRRSGELPGYKPKPRRKKLIIEEVH